MPSRVVADHKEGEAMESIAMCQQTIDAAGTVIGSVKQDDMARPTPCSEWNVRALVNHMIGVNYAFARALAGEKIEPGGQMPDLVGDDPAASYTALSYVAGWQGPFGSAIEEINATFVVPNMVARAVRGETPDAAMKWADGEYKRIFQKHGISNP
jgi:uncharacterized protein (TIGR03086 family)